MRSVFTIVMACLIATPLLAEGTLQLPVISGDNLGVPGMGNFTLLTSLEEFEVEDGKMYKLKGQMRFDDILGGTAGLVIEEIEFEYDPSVFFNATWTNNTMSVQTYTFSMTLPTIFGAPNLIYGATTVGVIDNGMDGATLASAPGIAVYQAQIDGVTVGTLFDDPFSLSAAPMGVNQIGTTFGWNPSNIAINTSMGIVHTFTLTPGDSASFLSRFDVVVPEPATVALLALGGLAVIRRRR